jgi:hypothetical protein
MSYQVFVFETVGGDDEQQQQQQKQQQQQQQPPHLPSSTSLPALGGSARAGAGGGRQPPPPRRRKAPARTKLKLKGQMGKRRPLQPAGGGGAQGRGSRVGGSGKRAVGGKRARAGPPAAGATVGGSTGGDGGNGDGDGGDGGDDDEDGDDDDDEPAWDEAGSSDSGSIRVDSRGGGSSVDAVAAAGASLLVKVPSVSTQGLVLDSILATPASAKVAREDAAATAGGAKAAAGGGGAGEEDGGRAPFAKGAGRQGSVGRPVGAPDEELQCVLLITAREQLMQRLRRLSGTVEASCDELQALELQHKAVRCTAAVEGDRRRLLTRLEHLQGDLRQLLREMRNASVGVLQAVRAWRAQLNRRDRKAMRSSPALHRFLWEGSCYLHRMQGDLGWLDLSDAISSWLGFGVGAENPLLLPPGVVDAMPALGSVVGDDDDDGGVGGGRVAAALAAAGPALDVLATFEGQRAQLLKERADERAAQQAELDRQRVLQMRQSMAQGRSVRNVGLALSAIMGKSRTARRASVDGLSQSIALKMAGLIPSRRKELTGGGGGDGGSESGSAASVTPSTMPLLGRRLGTDAADTRAAVAPNPLSVAMAAAKEAAESEAEAEVEEKPPPPRFAVRGLKALKKIDEAEEAANAKKRKDEEAAKAREAAALTAQNATPAGSPKNKAAADGSAPGGSFGPALSFSGSSRNLAALGASPAASPGGGGGSVGYDGGGGSSPSKKRSAEEEEKDHEEEEEGIVDGLLLMVAVPRPQLVLCEALPAAELLAAARAARGLREEAEAVAAWGALQRREAEWREEAYDPFQRVLARGGAEQLFADALRARDEVDGAAAGGPGGGNGGNGGNGNGAAEVLRRRQESVGRAAVLPAAKRAAIAEARAEAERLLFGASAAAVLPLGGDSSTFLTQRQAEIVVSSTAERAAVAEVSAVADAAAETPALPVLRASRLRLLEAAERGFAQRSAFLRTDAIGDPRGPRYAFADDDEEDLGAAGAPAPPGQRRRSAAADAVRLAAACVVQRVFRGYDHRRYCHWVREERRHLASTLIQARARGWLDRDAVAAQLEQRWLGEEEHAAAARLQAGCRGFLARRHAQLAGAERAVRLELHGHAREAEGGASAGGAGAGGGGGGGEDGELAAATQRGRAVKEGEEEREGEELEVAAAAAAADSDLMAQLAAAEAEARRAALIAHEARQQQAALCVQACFRRFTLAGRLLGRGRAKSRGGAIVSLQRVWRGGLARGTYTEIRSAGVRNDASEVIQRGARARQARVAVGRLRAARLAREEAERAAAKAEQNRLDAIAAAERAARAKAAEEARAVAAAELAAAKAEAAAVAKASGEGERRASRNSRREARKAAKSRDGSSSRGKRSGGSKRNLREKEELKGSELKLDL